MWMAADHFGDHGFDHVIKCEASFLGCHLCMIDGLQQQIAQLVAEVGLVAALDRIGHLIGFLDCVGRYGREILLQVPGAARDWSPQRLHDSAEGGNVARIHGGGV